MLFLVNLEGWGSQTAETREAALLYVYQVMRTPGTTWKWESAPNTDDNPGAIKFDTAKIGIDGRWVNTGRTNRSYRSITISEIASP